MRPRLLQLILLPNHATKPLCLRGNRVAKGRGEESRWRREENKAEKEVMKSA